MRTAPISNPLRNARSWSYITLVVFTWSAARLFDPWHGGIASGIVWLPPCPLRSLTGCPCPFCGLTTGIAWLTRWDWRAAWSSNILSPFLFLFFAALGIYTVFFRFLAGRMLEWQISSPARRRLWLAGGLLVALSWLVNLLRVF